MCFPPATVSFRVEGAQTTLYDIPELKTNAQKVNTPSGGEHDCNGLNGGQPGCPGPTCTTALSDAARRQIFEFDGTWSDKYQDFFINRIANESSTNALFWGIYLNYTPTPVGGCQARVRDGDEVLFALTSTTGGPQTVLKLFGPSPILVGQPTVFTVTSGTSTRPISGATVFVSGTHAPPPGTTNPSGQVTFTFHTAGEFALKANAPNSIRSNTLRVFVPALP